MDTSGVIPENLLIAYINFYIRNFPEKKDNIFHLCRFLRQEGITNQYVEVRTHFNYIKSQNITPEKIVKNEYEDNYFEGGFGHEDSLRIAYQMALYNDLDRSIN